MLTALLAAPRTVGAQLCGDVDGSGHIDVIDGANVARAAVGLPSSCTAGTCDVNADGVVNVIDSANVARAAVGLPAMLSCGPADLVDSAISCTSGVVTCKQDGTPGTLGLGFAPLPNAPQTVTQVLPLFGVQSAATRGRSIAANIRYDAGVDGAGLGQTPTLIVTAHRTDEEIDERGFFELPLDTAAGERDIVLDFPPDLQDEPFVVQLTTMTGLEVAEYLTFQVFPTDPPTCGDLAVDAPEECDPPGSGSAEAGFCAIGCQLVDDPPPPCGNGLRGLGEACDDANTANGDCCSSTCQFEPAGSPCNDGNSCTLGDQCTGGGVCVGSTACGNGVRDAFCGEACDGFDAAQCGGGGCLGNCTCAGPTPTRTPTPTPTLTPGCGNGVKEPGETCDGADNGFCDGLACVGDCTCQGYDCAHVDLGRTVPVQTSGTTAGGSNFLGGECNPAGALERVFRFTAPSARSYTVRLTTSSYPALLHARTRCENAIELGCDQNSGPGGQPQIVLNLQADQSVIIVVDGAVAGAAGTFTLRID